MIGFPHLSTPHSLSVISYRFLSFLCPLIDTTYIETTSLSVVFCTSILEGSYCKLFSAYVLV